MISQASTNDCVENHFSLDRQLRLLFEGSGSCRIGNFSITQPFRSCGRSARFLQVQGCQAKEVVQCIQSGVSDGGFAEVQVDGFLQDASGIEFLQLFIGNVGTTEIQLENWVILGDLNDFGNERLVDVRIGKIDAPTGHLKPMHGFPLFDRAPPCRRNDSGKPLFLLFEFVVFTRSIVPTTSR